MGTLVKAICTSCDFRRKFSFGHGMMDHETMFKVPALDKDNKFTVVNIKEDLFQEFRLYTDSSMYENELPEGEGIQWGQYYLSPKANLCPNCKQKVMDFTVYGQFD